LPVFDISDFIGGLNTPIHNYHARRAQSAAAASLPTANRLSATSTASPSSPVLTLAYGGNELLSVGFQIYCLNGGVNNDTASNAPCTTGGGSAVSSFNVQLTTYTGSPQRVLAVAVDQVTRGTDGGSNSGNSYANLVLDIKKYGMTDRPIHATEGFVCLY
jgi:hypothetical protein